MPLSDQDSHATLLRSDDETLARAPDSNDPGATQVAEPTKAQAFEVKLNPAAEASPSVNAEDATLLVARAQSPQPRTESSRAQDLDQTQIMPVPARDTEDQATLILDRANMHHGQAQLVQSPADQSFNQAPTLARTQGASVKAHDQANLTQVTQTLNPLTKTLHAPFAAGGDVINNRFIIEKILGQGGMGMVCKALDLRKVEADDQQPYVAIKLLSGDFQEHPNAFKSLQREAKKSQALAHPNIITVYDFDRDGDTIFMTMEVLDGHPLDAIIKGNTDITLSRKQAQSIIRQIAQALAYAHSKGIIHSDLKPANIFYTHTGQVKVLDFGIARALNSELYKDNFDAGVLNAITPKYASLEMFEQQPPDARDDIYALGLISAELLCGQHPYGGAQAIAVKAQGIKPTLNKSLGLLFQKLILQAIEIERPKRTQSAQKFLSRLNWAEKGPRRALISALILTLLISANALLIDAVDKDIPLADLPPATQTLVIHNLAEADTALKFNDYDGALLYLERIFEVHPSNHDLAARTNQILKALKSALETSQDAEARKFLLQQLQGIGNYKCIASNKQYEALRKSQALGTTP